MNPSRRSLLCAGAALACAPSHAQVLEFGVLGVPPYSLQQDEGPIVGLYAEIIEAIARRAGLQVRLRRYPLARVLQQVESGALAGTLAIADARLLSLVDSAGEVLRLQSVVAGRPGTRVASLADLRDGNVCLLRGASFEPRLYEDPRIRLTELSDYPACWAMLQAGRVTHIASPRPGLWWLQKSGVIPADGLGELHVLNERAVHLLLSRKLADPAVARALADGLRQARSDGTIDAIMKRYGQ